MSRRHPSPQTPVPPQNLHAEETVLGALLLAGASGLEPSRRLVERLREVGLERNHFYFVERHGAIYAAAEALVARDEPCDAGLVIAELERRGELEAIGGIARIRELAALVPATGNAPHHARLIREAARQRALIRELGPVVDAAWNGGADPGETLEALERARTVLETSSGGHERFRGLSHAEALARQVPPTRLLVSNLIEAGTPGTIAGLPEAHKSGLAVEVACKIAAGGRVLGRFEVLRQGAVGYWWQDDSEGNELARLQGYAARQGFSEALPIRWHLNEGVRLPDDIPMLRAEIEREGQVRIVLDSLYNVLSPKLDLRDESVGQVIVRVKEEVCNPTGCAVAFVDHAPWPTEGNRGQRRGYGSVFKAAASRWGIYLERDDSGGVWIEARGNNITGLKRTLAVWDEERLELRLPDPPKARSVADDIADFLERNAGATTTVVEAAIRGNATQIREALKRDERFARVPPILFGKPRNAVCWALRDRVPGLLSTTSSREGDDVGTTLPRGTDENVVPPTNRDEVPRGGDDVGSQPRPDGDDVAGRA